jgi:hypothetical protein
MTAYMMVADQVGGARSHCRFVKPPIHFIPYSLTYSVPLFLKRQCDRTQQVGGLVATLDKLMATDDGDGEE